jgi:hypothetical protein
VEDDLGSNKDEEEEEEEDVLSEKELGFEAGLNEDEEESDDEERMLVVVTLTHLPLMNSQEKFQAPLLLDELPNQLPLPPQVLLPVSPVFVTPRR